MEIQTAAPAKDPVGLTFHFSKAWFARALTAHRLGQADWGLSHPPLRWGSIERPVLPAPDWVRVGVLQSGICGSDLGMLNATLSPVLSPLSSFPAVMGHEGVGEIIERGEEAEWSVGQRVVIDPFLGCEVRGLPLCPPCQAGMPALCRRQSEGAFAPGMMLGVCKDLPGLWSEEVLVHQSQLHRVPAGLSMDEAMLVEPLAVSLHAVLANLPKAGDTVLIIGAGTLGLLTVAALRAVGFSGQLVTVVRHEHQAELAKRLGSSLVLSARTLPEALVEAFGGRLVRAIDGHRVLLETGIDLVFDAVGTTDGLMTALSAVRPRGRVVVLGSPGRLRGVDGTWLWSKEVVLRGSMAYGREPSAGNRHTFDEAFRLLAQESAPPVREIITHRWPIEDYRSALKSYTREGTARPIKGAFLLRTRSEHGGADRTSRLDTDRYRQP